MLAITQISAAPDWADTPPCEKVILARELIVYEWILNAYLDLLTRESTLTDEEVDRIGWKTAIEIFKMREQAGAESGGEIESGPDWSKVLYEEMKLIMDKENALGIEELE